MRENEPVGVPDFLFTQRNVYRYLLHYEMTVCGYYWNPNRKYDMQRMSMELMRVDELVADKNIFNSVLSNYKFYVKPLEGEISTITMPVEEEEGWNYSTPSLVRYRGKTYANVRQVNYSINDAGEYICKNKIETRNWLVDMDVADERPRLLNYDVTWDDRYVGLEDVRIFAAKEEVGGGETLMYTCNRGLKQGVMRVEYGEIDWEKGETVGSRLLQYSGGGGGGGNAVEKNWVLISKERVIYKWYPLTIGRIQGDKMVVEKEDWNAPKFFQHLRGSTHGIRKGDEIWFLCHVVSYEKRRYYYHILVVLDAATLDMRRHSALFTLNGKEVEYTCGFIDCPEKESIQIGFSELDRCSRIITIPYKHFQFN
jgi:hypothetical protein